MIQQLYVKTRIISKNTKGYGKKGKTYLINSASQLNFQQPSQTGAQSPVSKEFLFPCMLF